MNPADLALKNAISLEAKKDALAQRQSGDWKVSFTVQGADMDARLTKAAMGTRYAVVLVEIGDDELPAQKEAREKPRPSARPTPPTDGATRMDWRDVQPSAQAVLRGKDAKFRAFLREKQGLFTVIDETTAANAIRAFCGVESRSELSSNHKARILWHQLDRDYEGWLAAERIGA